MSQIKIENLTFHYDGSYDNVFENASFQLDTDWKLGFIGRNGKGKTTLLKLLTGEYEYQGKIYSSVGFDYFPFEVKDKDEITKTVMRNMIAPFDLWERQMEELTACKTDEALAEYGEILERFMANDGYTVNERIEAEAMKLGVSSEALRRPWNTLSGGEQVKLTLGILFLKKNRFLLIDEPTNHLDIDGREAVADYLSQKKGFILVSHDRYFLDRIIDHVLSINKVNIEVVRGNYSSWLENKNRLENDQRIQSAELKKDISRLESSLKRTAGWSFEIEKSKKGAADKGFVGAQSAKMMKRAKAIESRRQREIDEKSSLLQNEEQVFPLKLHILPCPKKRIITAHNLSMGYGGNELFNGLSFTVDEGERIALCGKNGSGKSSLLKLILGDEQLIGGLLSVASRLQISYIPQDSSFLKGTLSDYAKAEQLDESLFKTILQKLDFSRNQFEKDMSDFSQGQKKKVLIAQSLSREASLFVWDEPLNYIDVLSRVQIENLILEYQPTLLFIEHDRLFQEKIATRKIVIE